MHRWSFFNLKIDEGYVISFHLFLPSVQMHVNGGFKDEYQDEGELTKVLQISINKVLKHYDKDTNFKKGFILLIGCGWGKGYAIEAPRLKHPNWRFVSMSVADLIRLSWLKEMNPSYFWRIQDGFEAVSKAGVKMVNPNGILNLIGWVRSNNGHFVPHAQLPERRISPKQPMMLQLPINLLREVRADADLSYDRHRIVDNTGTWHDVQRVTPNPLFSRNSSRRVYASMSDVRKETLTSVYEGQLKLWISMATPNITEKETEYRLWEMAHEWLHRIGDALDRHKGVPIKNQNLKVYIEFCDNIPTNEQHGPLALRDLYPLCKVEPHSEPNACKVVFEAGFFAGFGVAENIAERFFVRTLARAYLQLLGAKDCDGAAKAVESIVVPNNDARNFHLFRARRFIDYVYDTLPKELIAIDPVDDAAARIGLGWRVLETGQSNKIEGREACTKFLGKVVDTLLVEICESFATFSRLSTLKRLIANYEKANAEEEHWKRTSAAILGLHGDRPETANRIVEQLSKFAGAALASRILIEIALCACPIESNKQISNIELSKLIARAGLVVRIGGLSDAIYYNALVPELTISSLGDILFYDDFGHLIVEPMLARLIEEGFVAGAPLQKSNYEDPRIVAETKSMISDEFWDIWNLEMGFNIDEARSIIGALEDKGITDHTIIFTISQSEYLSLVCSDKVSENVAKKFLDQFSLATRPRWDRPPKGFNLKDIYPWRFGRRLSFVARPILKIDNNSDPVLIIAPGALRRGFTYVLDGAYNGRFEQAFFHSKEMRDIWWNKANEGHTFNAEVANILLEKGWQVRQNIGLPELLNRKIDPDYGDVDVLAWRIGHKEVLVIECKDLSQARNYSEIAALLSDYQGAETKGEPDKLKRHLNRVKLLQENSDQVQRLQISC